MADKPDIKLLIRSYANSFTKTEKKIADYIMNNIQEAVYLSVTDMAEKADVGETTVLRFCRKLNFRGFQDFKISLARTSSAGSDQSGEDGQEFSGDKEKRVSHVINTHIEVIKDTSQYADAESIEKVVQYIVESDKISFFGVGTSGLVSAQAAHTFLRIGKPSEAVQDCHFQAMAASMLSEKDTAFGISVSGETKDTIDHLKIAKTRGARIVAMTSSARSAITKIADITLLVAGKENPLHGSSITSIMSQLSVIDVLYNGVLEQTKDTALEVRERTARAVSDKQS
ncbi:MurR/RpiR family transcriptional regulator [Jeotgalibacillus terrae]|uniref:MurR/RpiR family transcriptional regulator n=1 Tax=Jeotgalibacillus terrae TaxID=587735 RepID=A0ABW5ZEF3_9BACL|nr:MurR/RpiR family transcriptional regulator [Jeotgalibacillus terrae]MBM7580127.1 DNA-binding MurR/RpiR family transcriptional regulator [Jeotgalibacillus terrae]